MSSNQKMEYRALRGTEDILPTESAVWAWVEAQYRQVCARYGYTEVRTPLIEEAALFTRSVGESTDIVQKEMYLFADAGGRRIALRPEATASMARAYVQHDLAKQEGLVKWCYLGPMFRAERPQAGRKRQFHQLGIEAIGSSHPLIDAEVVVLARSVLEAVGITGTRIQMNNVGCRADRERASRQLRQVLQPHATALCEDCRARLQRNVFRVLDCKEPSCQAIVKQLDVRMNPCDACHAHYAEMLAALCETGITVAEDPRLVRGLDYYTKTVFELSHPALGAQDAIGAGGRYDDLVHDLGGPAVGACGFALGMERMLMARAAAAAAPTSDAPRVSVMVMALDAAGQRDSFQLLQQLRAARIAAVMDYESRSLKGQMRSAHKWGARFAAILGAQERANGTVTLKDMQSGSQESIARAQLVAAVQRAGTAA